MNSQASVLLPFYERSLKTSSRVTGIPKNRIYLSKEAIFGPLIKKISDLPQKQKLDFIRSFIEDFPSVIDFDRIMPLDVYVPHLSKTQQAVLHLVLLEYSYSDSYRQIAKDLKISDKLVDGNVSVFDYDTIVDEIQIYPDTNEARYQGNGGILVSEFSKTVFFDTAENYERLSDSDMEQFRQSFYSTYTPESSKESLDQPALKSGYFDSYRDKYFDELGNMAFDAYDIDTAVSSKDLGKEKSYKQQTSGAERTLELALQGEQKGNKSVPCLVGLSGVAKSAIVKNVANKAGFRFVDFRAAFLDRLDLEGMYYMVSEDGEILNFDRGDVAKKFSKQAYLGEFVKCSDQYIEYAKSMVNKLEAVKTSKEGDDNYEFKQTLGEGFFEETEPENEGDPVKPSKIDVIIEKFREESKPAYLFFDEIIRAKPKILNLFTTLLDVKRFGTVTFYNTKICAAANTPHGLSNIEDGSELFIGQEASDPAILNRFSIIPVTPQEVYPSWIEWIQSQNWDGLVVAFVSRNIIHAYGLDFLNSSASIDVKRQSTYPTFRAWEQINRILKHYNETTFITKDSILGLLGEDVGSTFVDFLTDSSVEFSAKSEISDQPVSVDPMLAMLENNIETGVASGIFSPSGMGKCVTGDTIIIVDGLIREIASLDFADEGYLDKEYKILSDLGELKAEATYKSSKEDIIGIVLENGLSLKGIAKHPLRVLDEKEGLIWKSLKDIKISDLVGVSRRVDTHEIIQDDFWWMYGFILGDGSVNHNIRESSMYDTATLHFLPEFEGIIKDVVTKLGYKEDLTKTLKHECFTSKREIGTYRRRIKRNVYTDLIGYDLVVSQNDFIKYELPVNITRNQFFNMMAGLLDSDGSLKAGNSIELCFKSEKLTSDITKYLALFGLTGYYNEKNTNCGEYNGKAYRIRLNKESSINLSKVIKNSCKVKYEQINSFIDDEVTQDYYTYASGKYQSEIEKLVDEPHRVLSTLEYKQRRKIIGSGYENFKTRGIYSPLRMEELINKFDLKISDELYELFGMRFFPVVEKENLPPEITYDVTIPIGQRFLANGIVSHNTSRVEDICKARGHELLTIQMSQKSLSDIMGAPTTIDVSTYMLGDLSKGLDPVKEGSVINILSNEALNEVDGLPDRVTIRAPQQEIKDKIDTVRAMRALNGSTKLVVFFDEVNRFAEGQESVQSAVFEAISDYRYAGIQFEPDEISVVCAANVNYEDTYNESPVKDSVDQELEKVYGEKPTYTGTKPIDSALRLRLAAMDIKKITYEDVKSVRNYVGSEANGFHPIIQTFIKDSSDDEVLLMMRSAEYKSIDRNVPAIRNFKTLSNVMRDSPSFWGGAWFFPTSGHVTKYNLDIKGNPSDSERVADTMRFLRNSSVVSNWVALAYKESLPIDIPNADTPQELLTAVVAVGEEFKVNGATPALVKFVPVLTDAILRVEDIIRNSFKEVTTSYIGDSKDQLGIVAKFLDTYFENVSGYGEVRMEGIVDRPTAKEWVEKVFLDEINIDTLIQEKMMPCLTYLDSVNRFDCIAYVLLESVEDLDDTKAPVFFSNVLNHGVFQSNDVYFSTFNDQIIKAIKTSKVKTLGNEYELLIKPKPTTKPAGKSTPKATASKSPTKKN